MKSIIQICFFVGSIPFCSLGDEVQERDSAQALLVGCTVYESGNSLKGPANDVVMFHELLVNRFGFKSKNIRRLVESRVATDRPTRANIVREIERLIREAVPHQQIVLFFGGHGSQQPDQLQSDPNDPEPDGLDEIFLPIDAEAPDPKTLNVRNAIIDDEFRNWCEQLLAKEVDVLIIFDTCHSGTLMRDDEPARFIPMQRFLPKSLQQSSSTSNPAPTTDLHHHDAPRDRLGKGRWIALYAAQPRETTVELKLPEDSKEAKWHGLFSYSLCRVLNEGSIPSYRELIQRIRGQYISKSRLTPCPMIEGIDIERGVLGAPPGKPSFALELDGSGRWILNAGKLHGCSERSILAVRDIGTNVESAPKAYVRVVEAGLAQSRVEPCEFEDRPRKKDLPKAGLCEIVYSDFGDLRLKVNFDPDSPNSDNLVTRVKELTRASDAPIAITEKPESADWLIKHDKGSGWILVPRSSPKKDAAQVELTNSAYLLPEDPTRLKEMLRRINTACNLLAFTSSLGNQRDEKGIRLDLDVLHKRSDVNDAPKSIPINGLSKIFAGDKLQFIVTNKCSIEIDFTLLFVDSEFGIRALFPEDGQSGNRLYPGQRWDKLPLLKVLPETAGREYVLLIAVPSGPIPKSFAFLEQPNLLDSKVERSTDSPFDRLLRSAVLGDRIERGSKSFPGSPVIISQSWIVIPANR